VLPHGRCRCPIGRLVLRKGNWQGPGDRFGCDEAGLTIDGTTTNQLKCNGYSSTDLINPRGSCNDVAALGWLIISNSLFKSPPRDALWVQVLGEQILLVIPSPEHCGNGWVVIWRKSFTLGEKRLVSSRTNLF